jgi:hypothetical protein
MRRTILLPASVGIALLLACALALLAALASAPTASAASNDHGASFAVRCDFSHRNWDDPIVHPGKQGAAHGHDFFGNRSAKFNSTYQSMIRASTTCTRPADTAGYWFPTVKWNGKNRRAHRAVFYYRAGGKAHTNVKAFAPSLKIVNGSRIRWYCGSEDGKAGSADPPTRCASGVLGLRIVFPDCVAKNSSGGQKLDSADHKSHMARSVRKSAGGRRCPSAHPVPVPTLTINANFAIPTTSGKVTLSSGPASSMHADFWNTWDQAALKRLVVACINNVPPGEPRPEGCRAPTAAA